MMPDLQLIKTAPLPTWWPAESELIAFFQGAMPVHRFLPLTYKLTLLKGFARLFPDGPCRVLDLGAGDGLMATAISRFFPVGEIFGVDVVERIHPAARLEFLVYDGLTLPYPDQHFDVVLTCNVLHHVPIPNRSALLTEVARVTRSTILIKDHLARGPWSRTSLGLADWVGNAPFGGMVKADYLSQDDWDTLTANLPFERNWFKGLGLQRGVRNWIFPDENEIMIRLTRKAHP
jgi:SAM-dependent methyltransferase